MGYCNEDLDQLLLDAKTSLDPAEREELYRQASQIIWDDAICMFPADLSNNTAYRDNVEGYAIPSNGRPVFATISITG